MSLHIYTDGSAIGNPGPGGWAFCMVPDGYDHRKQGKSLSSTGSTGPKPFLKGGGEADTTNNQMELQAAIEALGAILDKLKVPRPVASIETLPGGLWFASVEQGVGENGGLGTCELIDMEIVLHTDSSYVQQGITSWITTWKKRDWRRAKGGQMVANADRWMTLDAYAQCFSALEWKRVKAHVGTHFNEIVDHEARRWATQMQRG